MSKLFSDIYGQKQAISILSAQLKSGNLSHGYVFLGNEGTGKGYLAAEFARYILNSAASDQEIHNNPDFIFVDGSAGIKIETIREVIERINLSPNQSSRKVVLLTRAENLGIEAANALLKTLEEPPADSIIILTAISEKSLPQTIVSRVQKIKLNQLGTSEIEKILSKDFSATEIEKVAAYSEGSIGEAKKLLLDPEYQEQKAAIFKDVETIFETKSIVEKFKVLERHEKEKNLKNFFDIFAGVVFESLKAQVAGAPVTMAAQKLSPNQLLAIAHKILKIYADLDYNINLRLAMEGLLLSQLAYD